MKKTLANCDPSVLAGRRVIVRSDLNVPMDGARVADDQRIVASLPTIRMLVDAGARVLVLSHLGRPKGEVDPGLSLAPVAERLGAVLGREVRFGPDPLGRGVAEPISGEVVLLENTRFELGETRNDTELARSWADLGDLFVNDAFGTAHRAHASTVGIASAMRSKGGDAVSGLLMARELRYLGDALREPDRPFVAILGGAKISGKIDVISALSSRVDRLLVGGAMANTFFRALGLDTGASLVEEDRIEMARELLEVVGDTLLLPTDCVVAESLEVGARSRVVHRSQVEEADHIVDVGPETVTAFDEVIGRARTVVWNGPMGVFEVPDFSRGTEGVAHSVADACDGGALVVVGGGDSAAAAHLAGVSDRLSHISSGGGASLALLAGQELPGVESLSDGA